ncbi:MAG: nuclear pore complex subunit [Flavobacteriales bacterium CG_4_10_14_0_2_um_filter_32_8]|nr:MAG: nuclear pore complex subunit [Flavobacteriales bacterium CG_4_10_14_0_2_um_filter_32_8]PJB15488.1 MAG: nuclear pore complex subunit [Flavobacteriales bacterium CG_4_9_14_3_um_filter_32_8]
MKDIKIEGSPKTPIIEFNPSTGYLLVRGRSIPENSIDFYKSLIDALEAYNINSQPDTKVDIQLEYFNTSSSKCILDVFKKLEVINSGGSNVVINWYYEEDDEDMLEAGEDYQAIINVPFKMIEVEEK